MIYTYNLPAYFGVFQYFSQATFALVVWDHLITIPDEVEYVWKREKSWGKSRRISSQDDVLMIVQHSGFSSWFALVELLALSTSGC